MYGGRERRPAGPAGTARGRRSRAGPSRRRRGPARRRREQIDGAGLAGLDRLEPEPGRPAATSRSANLEPASPCAMSSLTWPPPCADGRAREATASSLAVILGRSGPETRIGRIAQSGWVRACARRGARVVRPRTRRSPSRVGDVHAPAREPGAHAVQVAEQARRVGRQGLQVHARLAQRAVGPLQQAGGRGGGRQPVAVRVGHAQAGARRAAGHLALRLHLEHGAVRRPAEPAQRPGEQARVRAPERARRGLHDHHAERQDRGVDDRIEPGDVEARSRAATGSARGAARAPSCT